MFKANCNRIAGIEDIKLNGLDKISGAASLGIILLMIIHTIVLASNPPPNVWAVKLLSSYN